MSDTVEIDREVLERLAFETDEHVRRCNTGEYLTDETAPIYGRGDETVWAITEAYDALQETRFYAPRATPRQ